MKAFHELNVILQVFAILVIIIIIIINANKLLSGKKCKVLVPTSKWNYIWWLLNMLFFTPFYFYTKDSDLTFSRIKINNKAESLISNYSS